MIKPGNNLYLNLGSGPNSVKGWVNYDWGLMPTLASLGMLGWVKIFGLLGEEYSLDWPKLKLRNLKKGLSEEDGSVGAVYCSHVLEHFQRKDALRIIKECHRVLADKGILRVVLPDLNKVKMIEDGDEFNRVYWGYDKEKFKGLVGRLKERFVRPHLWMYNPPSFEKLLKEAGFERIRFYDFRKGKTPDINKLDLEIHKPLSFYVEAIK